MAIPYEPGRPLPCEQVRELDRIAIEQVGIPGIVLMENAARGAAEFIFTLIANSPATPTTILCGPGNNGGDGFAIARHLRNAGVPVTVVLAAPQSRYTSDAAANLAVYRHMSGPLLDATTPDGLQQSRHAIAQSRVIVDALLGTGSRGNPRGVAADLVLAANEHAAATKVAIDIPSGLDGDTGVPGDPCFRADATVTFVAAKIGFSQPGAADFTGRVIVADIGIPRDLIPTREKNSRSG